MQITVIMKKMLARTTLKSSRLNAVFHRLVLDTFIGPILQTTLDRTVRLDFDGTSTTGKIKYAEIRRPTAGNRIFAKLAGHYGKFPMDGISGTGEIWGNQSWWLQYNREDGNPVHFRIESSPRKTTVHGYRMDGVTFDGSVVVSEPEKVKKDSVYAIMQDWPIIGPFTFFLQLNLPREVFHEADPGACGSFTITGAVVNLITHEKLPIHFGFKIKESQEINGIMTPTLLAWESKLPFMIVSVPKNGPIEASFEGAASLQESFLIKRTDSGSSGAETKRFRRKGTDPAHRSLQEGS